MNLAIMQPYFLPYIGYWQLIHGVDTFVLYDDANYIKQGYINRNNILVNGHSTLFTLEVIGASSNKKINEVKVGNNSKKILKTIKQNYIKAKYFEMAYPVLEDIFNYQEKNIGKFIGHALQYISKFIQIDTNFIYSSNIKKNDSLRAQDKVIDICKVLNANTYINSIGGQNLYDKKVFNRNNIELYFTKTEPQKYQQFGNEFVPNLSIIDILMFNSVDEIRNMLDKYQLV